MKLLWLTFWLVVGAAALAAALLTVPSMLSTHFSFQIVYATRLY